MDAQVLPDVPRPTNPPTTIDRVRKDTRSNHVGIGTVRESGEGDGTCCTRGSELLGREITFLSLIAMGRVVPLIDVLRWLWLLHKGPGTGASLDYNGEYISWCRVAKMDG